MILCAENAQKPDTKEEMLTAISCRIQRKKPSEPDKDSRGASTGGKSKGGSEKSVDRKKKDDRGRTSGQQTMLRSMMDLHSMRSRSETQSAGDLERSPAPTPWKCRNR